MIILKTRSEVKVTVPRKWYVTLCHAKMHSHIKFGISTSKNIGYIYTSINADSRNYDTAQGQGHSDPRMVRDTLSSQAARTYQIWDSYLK